MQDYEYMYEVCLCSVLEDRSHMETLFTRFKGTGRKGETVCVVFSVKPRIAGDQTSFRNCWNNKREWSTLVWNAQMFHQAHTGQPFLPPTTTPLLN